MHRIAHTQPTLGTPQQSLRLVNREAGILAFNDRVLAMAEDPAVPLLERMRYVCIVSNNLDEFFEIRVAGLLEQLRQKPLWRDVDGLTAAESLQQLSDRAHSLVARQYDILNHTLLPLLAEHGIYFHLAAGWDDAQRAWAEDFFNRDILPVLTPIGLDPAHPFPKVLNKSLNFVIELEGEDAFERQTPIAIVQAPRTLRRIIPVPQSISGFAHGFMMLTSIMQGHVAALFPGMTIKGVHQFRVTRNSDLFVDDEEITNLRTALQGELSQRHYGDAVRLEVSDTTPDHVMLMLRDQFELNDRECYRVKGPVNLVRLMQLPDMVDLPDLKFPAYQPTVPAELHSSGLFDTLQRRDVLLHHPYQSFMPIAQFLRQAALDPDVVAIKQTIYRTGQTSELMESLLIAARAGKEVTAVVELMARFDEETNINWAARLEEVGAHVVYGVVGHKTHAKLALVVRREDGMLRRYAHLGTGNYHPRTARLYTDFGLLTADPATCADVHEVFRQLTGPGKAQPLHRLWQSPFSLHANVLRGIAREADHARQGKSARIIAKMNALLEPQVIEALYAASCAGVKIDLIVRGVCALRPGVPGMSDNIRVRSIIGQFLEHARVFYFLDDGAESVWLSSADWMDRNFFRRVEIAFPIRDPKLKKRVIDEAFRYALRDNVGAWTMDSDGHYQRRRSRSATGVSVQAILRTKYGERD